MEEEVGRPKKETNGFKNKKTNGFEIKKPNENVNENENENENVNENADRSDSCDDGFQEVIDFYNENIGLLTPYGAEVLEDYAQDMGIDLIILAMKKAVEKDAKHIKYIKSILNNWDKKGIKTVIEAEKEAMNFKNKDNSNNETEEEKNKRKIKELEELMSANK